MEKLIKMLQEIGMELLTNNELVKHPELQQATLKVITGVLHLGMYERNKEK